MCGSTHTIYFLRRVDYTRLRTNLRDCIEYTYFFLIYEANKEYPRWSNYLSNCVWEYTSFFLTLCDRLSIIRLGLDQKLFQYSLWGSLKLKKAKAAHQQFVTKKKQWTWSWLNMLSLRYCLKYRFFFWGGGFRAF